MYPLAPVTSTLTVRSLSRCGERGNSLPGVRGRARGVGGGVADGSVYCSVVRGATRVKDLAAALGGEALALAARALFRTLRFESVGLERAAEQVRAGRAVILVGWHGHDLIHLAAFRRLFPEARGAIIVEDNTAGHLLKRAAARLGLDGTALSLDPDSTRSARGIVRFAALVRAGTLGLLAVDGPAGPAREVKAGAAFIAQRADAVLIPCATAARPSVGLPRWDRHLVPLPFARVVTVMGEPIETRSVAAGRTPTVESLTETIARSLGEVVARANARCRSSVD